MHGNATILIRLSEVNIYSLDAGFILPPYCLDTGLTLPPYSLVAGFILPPCCLNTGFILPPYCLDTGFVLPPYSLDAGLVLICLGYCLTTMLMGFVLGSMNPVTTYWLVTT